VYIYADGHPRPPPVVRRPPDLQGSLARSGGQDWVSIGEVDSEMIVVAIALDLVVWREGVSNPAKVLETRGPCR
jgi:hypothetical protein